jgi:transposase-like protein
MYKSLRKKCLEHGISDGTVRSRLKRGIPLHVALSTLPGPRGRRGAATVGALARAHGLKPQTVYARLIKGDSNPTRPISYGSDATSITKAARAAGENHQTIRRRVRKYGLTLEQALSCPKDNRCQSCGKVAVLQTDHDHKRKQFRGWLCWGCNSAIGKLGDDIAGLERALTYLRKTSDV